MFIKIQEGKMSKLKLTIPSGIITTHPISAKELIENGANKMKSVLSQFQDSSSSSSNSSGSEIQKTIQTQEFDPTSQE
jgi:hypothetical protein